MNLIQLYLEKEDRRARLEEEKRRAADPWYEFHNTNEQSMVVVGGRRSGKTYNLVKKVMEAPEARVLVIAPSISTMRTIFNMMAELYVTEIESASWSSYEGRIITNNRRQIHFERGNKVDLALYRGLRYDLIAYDEPELMYQFLEQFRNSVLRQMRTDRSIRVREIAVGSLTSVSMYTEFKSMFKDAHWKTTIETPDLNRQGKLDFRLNPARFIHQFENLEESQAI